MTRIMNVTELFNVMEKKMRLAVVERLMWMTEKSVKWMLGGRMNTNVTSSTNSHQVVSVVRCSSALQEMEGSRDLKFVFQVSSSVTIACNARVVKTSTTVMNNISKRRSSEWRRTSSAPVVT